MAYLLLSAAKRFRQPRGTVGVNWADSITDRLCLAVNWRDGICFNHVSGELGQTEPHSTYDKRGDLVGRTANVSYPYVGKFNTDHLVKTSNGSGTGDFSFFSLSSPQKSASYPEALLSMNGTSSGTQTILMVNRDENMSTLTNVVTFGVFWNGTPYLVQGTGTPWNSGEPTTFTGVRSGTTYYVDANGVQLNSATRSAQNIFDTFDLVNIGGMEGYSSGWSRPSTTHFGALAWNRALSAPERREIGRWPWMWTKSDPQRTYFDLTKAQEIRDQVAEVAAPKRPIVKISAQKLCTTQPIGAVKPKFSYDPIVLFNAASGTTDCVTGYTAAGRVTEFNTTHGIANENTNGAFYYSGKQYYRANNRSSFTAFVVAYRLGSSSGDFLAYTNGGYGWRMRIEDYEWNQAAVKFLANWSGNGASAYTPQAMGWYRNTCAVIGISVDCITRAYSFYMNGKPIGSGTLVYEVDPVQDTNANNSLVWVAYNTGIKIVTTGLLYGANHDLASLTSNPWQVFASNTPIYTSLTQANGTMRPTVMR